MSIVAQIERLELEGQLFRFPTLYESSPRRVYMSNDVADLYDKGVDELEIDERYALMIGRFDYFARNKRIPLRWRRRANGGSAMLARAEPHNQYVFDFRSAGLEGGIRVFGSFAQKDWFVALTWDFREGLDWAAEVQASRQSWIDLFGTPPPELGATPDAFVGNYQTV